MSYESPHRRPRWRACAFGLCAAVAASGAPGVALAQEAAVEEVVVTGSYIRRGDSFDTATPIDVLDREDLEQRGQSDFGQILRNQSFNYGVDAAENILAGTPATGSVSQANLRGLGTGATLTLLNGRRTASQNVQSLYPGIMVERIETLTDGASTIYGTDAVAGVVNLIPRQDFRGLEVQVQQNNADDWDETTWSVITGTGGDKTSIVAGLTYRERSQLQFRDRPNFLAAGVTSSADSPVGNYLVGSRDEDGNLQPPTGLTGDPGCGVGAGTAFPADKTKPGNFITGRPSALSSSPCRREFGEDFNYISPMEVFSGLMLVEHRFTEHVRFNGELLFNHQSVDARGSASNPGGQLSRLPTIPGTHPGNPFRALDANDNPLFAVDSDGDGVPDRGSNDADGNGLNDVVVAGADPNATGPNGNPVVPFNEDVRISRWRPIGKITNPQPLRTNADGSGEGDSTFETDNFRWAGRLTVDIPNTSWQVYGDYLFHQLDTVMPSRVESLAAIQEGLVGNLNVFDEGTQQPVSDVWFNPFATQRLTCDDQRNCSLTDSPDFPNRQEVVDRVATTDNEASEFTLTVQEIVASGNLIDLPAGPLGVAVGAQRRYASLNNDFGAVGNQRDVFIAIQTRDFQENRETRAGFLELQIPVFDTPALGVLELNAAGRVVRADDDSDADLDSEIFKVSGRWEPRPWIALRGSVGEAFIAPELDELFEPPTFALSNVTDALTGESSTFKARGVGGNPDLQPEKSDQFNAGVTLRLLDGDLTISADWHFFDFEDRIVRPIPQDILNSDIDRFTALCNAGGGSTCGSGPFEGLETNPEEFDLGQAEEQFILFNPNFDGTAAAANRMLPAGTPGESENVLRSVTRWWSSASRRRSSMPNRRSGRAGTTA